MKVKNAEWRKSMQISIDYNNMMAEYIGQAQGFSQKDFSDNKKLVQSAFETVSKNRGTGMMGWTELPYNQKEIVDDIIETAKNIKKKFDNFTQSNKIYDIVYIMKFLMPDNKEWNNFILPTIASIFEEYKEYINLSCYGFPQNWDSALKIN